VFLFAVGLSLYGMIRDPFVETGDIYLADTHVSQIGMGDVIVNIEDIVVDMFVNVVDDLSFAVKLDL